MSDFWCARCSSRFDTPVWHCRRCNRHWPADRDACGNCHAARPAAEWLRKQSKPTAAPPVVDARPTAGPWAETLFDIDSPEMWRS